MLFFSDCNNRKFFSTELRKLKKIRDVAVLDTAVDFT